MHLALFRLRFLLLLAAFFALTGSYAQAQTVMAKPNQNSFGKNRIQYKNFNWQYYQSANFNVYHYQGGSEMAQNAAEFAEAELQRISALVGYYPYSRITLLLYNSTTDLQQSNVGLSAFQNSGPGQAFFSSSKVEIAFNGLQTEWKYQLSYHIAELLLNDMMYGGSLKEVLQSSYLLQLPDWFISGAAAYLAEGWSIASDDFVRDIVLTNKRKRAEKMLAANPRLAGQAIWNYIVEQYGIGSIQNILNLTRITRDVEIGISNTVGGSYDSFNRNWLNYYTRTNEPLLDEFSLPIDSARITPGRIGSHIISEAYFSPDGTKLTYVNNEIGRYRVKIYDFTTGKTSILFRGGYRNNEQKADYRVPQLAWKDNQTLSAVVALKGTLVLRNYDLKGKKLGEMPLAGVTQVHGMNYSADGKWLALSMARNGQSDIYVLKPGSRAPQQITNDLYDDVHPAFAGSTDRILFSSNRTSDSLGTDKGTFSAIANNYDIFLLETGRGSNRFSQLTTSITNEFRPGQLDNREFVYLSEDNGIRGLYRQAVSAPGPEQQVSDFVLSMRSYSYHPGSGKLAFITPKNNKEGIYLYSNFGASAKNTSQKTQRQKTLENRLNPGTTGQNNSGNQKNPVTPAPSDTTRRNPNRIDIYNYTFDNEPQVITPQNNTTQINRLNLLQTRNGVQSLKGPKPYSPQFSINSFTNTLRIDPFLGIGLVMEIGMMDLFEDHRFNGGVFFLTDFRTTHFYAEYAYLKKRFDLRLGYDKKAILSSDEFGRLRRFSMHEMRGTVSYPLSYSTSVRAIPRVATTRFTSINPLQLPDSNTDFFGGGLEVVFDNTLEQGINIIEGTRAKAGIETYRAVDDTDEHFNKLFFDVRHYLKIHRQITLANRATYGHSFGVAAKRYLVGGMENWFGNRAEDTLVLNVSAHPGEIFYTEFATPLRGFNYIARKGRNFILFNSELRIPIVQYFSRGPIYSGFLRNLQLQGFTDIGTAYDGVSPFNENNSYNNQVAGGSGNAFSANVTNYRNPFLIGYGFGMRTTIASLYTKLDVAWGEKNNQVRGPKFYFTLGYDF